MSPSIKASAGAVKELEASRDNFRLFAIQVHNTEPGIAQNDRALIREPFSFPRRKG